MSKYNNTESQYIEAMIAQAQNRFCAYNLLVHNAGRTESWKLSKFHRYLCDAVQEFVERPTDKPYEILIINTPPQHGKSMTITETLPSWYLGRHPDARTMIVCYSEDFAQKFGKRNKEKLSEFGEIFGVGLSKTTRSNTEWELDNNRGGMISRGFGSGLAGQKGNLIIMDDPFKTKAEAFSEARRNAIYDEWTHSVKTRTHPATKIILIMTRWHEDDLAGRIMSEELDCQVINLPCECDSEDDLLGRDIGDALCPEMGKDKAWMDTFKKSFMNSEGSTAWNAMFQGKPVAEGGNIIKKNWWQFYDLTEAFLRGLDEIAMSVDATFKDTGDKVAIEVWGRKDANFYLIDLINEQLDFPETMSAIIGMKGQYPKIRQIFVEDKANGSAVIAMLKSKIVGITAVEPYGGKISRVQEITFVIESGNVFLPKNKHFIKEFMAQCSAFPSGKHDDMVDAMSQLLSRMVFKKTYRETPKKNRLEDFFKTKNKTVTHTGKGEQINVV